MTCTLALPGEGTWGDAGVGGGGEGVRTMG